LWTSGDADRRNAWGGFTFRTAMAHKLTFRHVEAIRAVIVAGSVTGAASRLNVTQPAISHLLRDIEEILQFPLFDRHLGRLVPTRRAELLYREIERSFHGLGAINEFCLRLRESEQRTINIAAVPVISIALLPSVIREYRQIAGPDFFIVDSPSNEQVLAYVSSQKVDLGIALDSPPIPGIHSETLCEFRAMCLLPKGHRLEKVEIVTAADLIGDPMIGTTRFDRIPEIIADAFRDVGGLPRPAVECPAASAACAMVESGVGFALLDPVAAYPFRDSSILFKRFEPVIPFIFSAYWRETERAEFDRTLLLDIARDELWRIGQRFPSGMLGAAPPARGTAKAVAPHKEAKA
jgi:DNA-binding transcriptional LysR family regulator